MTTDQAQAIQWVEKNVRLIDVRPFEQNPRTITEVQFQKLKKSLSASFGQFKPLTVTHDLRLAGGHQRLRAMTELGWIECRVSVPSRELTDEEYRNIILADNHNNGTWDMDELANMFDLEELRDIGLHEVMSIPPMESGEEEPLPGKNQVKCPGCAEVFAVKGNRYVPE